MDKIITTKNKMTQVWKGDEVVPVTVLNVPNEQLGLVDSLKEGDIVDISGISKGKGFQGAVKRHGFSKGPATHGQRHTLRAPGSAGSVDPQRIMPGKKMPGRMGGDRITVQNLTVVEINKENQTILLKGAVPGFSGTRIEIRFTAEENNNKDQE